MSTARLNSSRACWGCVASNILAALSRAVTADSGDPCCWKRPQALWASFDTSDKFPISLQTSRACSMHLKTLHSYNIVICYVIKSKLCIYVIYTLLHGTIYFIIIAELKKIHEDVWNFSRNFRKKLSSYNTKFVFWIFLWKCSNWLLK